MAPEGLLAFLLMGLIAGYIASEIVRGSGMGLVGDLIIGVAGAFIGGLLLPQLGLHLANGLLSSIINAAIGAILLLLVIRLARGGGGWRGNFGRFGRRW